MHIDILSEKQQKLLPLVEKFNVDYYLVGGTALALYIGHRASIDFDLFTENNVKRKSIKNLLKRENISYTVIHEDFDQLHILIDDVKFTFFNFPFNVKHNQKFQDYISLPNLCDLAAMKAYALGGRAKWKDYVDFYFLLKNHFTILEIENKAKEIFKDSFNKKLFRQQLSYFKDINFSESVTFFNETPSEHEIMQFLIEQSTTNLLY